MRNPHPRDVAMAAIRAVEAEGWGGPKQPSPWSVSFARHRSPFVLTIAALGRDLAGLIDVTCGPISIRCRPSEVRAAVSHALAWIDRRGGDNA